MAGTTATSVAASNRLWPPGSGSRPLIPDVATRLAGQRLQELETARRRRAFHDGRAVETQLGAFARLHLIAKKKSGKVHRHSGSRSAELFLNRAVAYFGAERELDTIRVSDVRGWIACLEATIAPRAKRRLGPGTIRHHLNTLSNLYRRAQEEEVVLPGYNPVVGAHGEADARPPRGPVDRDPPRRAAARGRAPLAGRRAARRSTRGGGADAGGMGGGRY